MTASPSESSTGTLPEARLKQARRAVLAIFAMGGVLFTSWLSRIPSIRDQLGVREDELANVLIFSAVGAFAALSLTGWSVAKWGSKRVLVVSAFAFTIAYALLGIGAHLGLALLFGFGNFMGGFSFAFTNVTMNAEGAAIERRMGRTIMPQFHAAFSIGAILGTGVGAGLAWLDVEPMWQFIGVGVAMLVLRLMVIPAAVINGMPVKSGAERPSGPFAMARREYTDKRILLIGLVVLAASLSEGAAAQWASLAVVDGFGVHESTGAMFYGIFVVSMVTVRWWGTRLIDRLGRVAALRFSASSVLVGVLIYGTTPVLWLAPVGLIFWGMGAALSIPIGFSAAADNPKRAAAGVAAVSSVATLAGVAGPQVLGQFAHLWTTQHALLLICIPAVLALFVAPAANRRFFSEDGVEATEMPAGESPQTFMAK